MAKTYRWGIIGTGNIATQFATCLKVCDNAVLHAVGSRSQASADAFGDKFDIPTRHATYEGLINDPEVDVVYVSTPHSLHKENSIACLKAGKPVLSEKPFTLNVSESKEVIAVAKETGLFLMEGMWTRFFPAIKQVESWIASGAIGEPRMVRCDFGFYMEYGERNRLWDPALGGGSLLDVGIYPINLASIAFKDAPETIQGAAHINAQGIDEQAAFVLGYSGGRLATLSSAVRAQSDWNAYIYGETGMIKIHECFWRPHAATLIPREGDPTTFDEPLESIGFEHEIREVMGCLDAGLTECPTMPHSRTLEVMGTMDTLRKQWGLKYPGE